LNHLSRNSSFVLFEDPISDAFDRIGNLPGIHVVTPTIIRLSGRHHRSLLQCYVQQFSAT
jgi:hypothetical protein